MSNVSLIDSEVEKQAGLYTFTTEDTAFNRRVLLRFNKTNLHTCKPFPKLWFHQINQEDVSNKQMGNISNGTS